MNQPIQARQFESADWAVVIPSNRQVTSDLLDAFPADVSIYIVDDSNGTIKSTRPNVRVFYYSDQERMLGPRAYLVPRRSAACRNFAYYYIWRETDHSHIVTIDDDCYPDAGYLNRHSIVGTTQTWRTYTSASGWLNSIDLLPVPGPLYARGYPFWLRDNFKEYSIGNTQGRSVCNIGLWRRHLDFDGFDKFVIDRYNASYEYQPEQVCHARVGTPESPTLVPFSGMNVAFIRELLLIATQVPMNQHIGNSYQLQRFDDLWCGVLMQLLIDRHPDDCLTLGAPVVTHTRAGNLRREVGGEHYGHLIAPYFHEIVEDAIAETPVGKYVEMYIELCALAHEITLRRLGAGRIPQAYATVLARIFQDLAEWGRLFLKFT